MIFWVGFTVGDKVMLLSAGVIVVCFVGLGVCVGSFFSFAVTEGVEVEVVSDGVGEKNITSKEGCGGIGEIKLFLLFK